ncbi:MAG: flagellar biosynthetic protein FliO [Lachnospiraceae bacterium]|nr:flagellar biosynthetic protein FliO [Candidatus Colinaster equi]
MLLSNVKGGNSLIEFITVLLIFAIVLAVTYFVTRWIGQYQKMQTTGDNVEVLETSRISPSACVEILRVGSKYIAVAVSKESVTFLCELNKEDITIKADSGVGSFDFANVLNKVKKSMPNNNLKDEKGHEEK